LSQAQRDAEDAKAQEEFERQMDERSEDHEKFRDEERQHPVGALICQGDQDCAR
jgi:hypothetical protein